MQATAQRQSGSVIVYVIVGVLLTALAVGAIIVAQNRGGQQIASQPATEAPQSETGNTPDAQQPDKDKSADEQQQKAEKEAAEKKVAADKAKQQAEAKKAANYFVNSKWEHEYHLL